VYCRYLVAASNAAVLKTVNGVTQRIRPQDSESSAIVDASSRLLNTYGAWSSHPETLYSAGYLLDGNWFEAGTSWVSGAQIPDESSMQYTDLKWTFVSTVPGKDFAMFIFYDIIVTAVCSAAILYLCYKLVKIPDKQGPKREPLNIERVFGKIMANQVVLCGISLVMWLIWLITSKMGTDEMADFVLQDIAANANEEVMSRWSEFPRELMVMNLLNAHGLIDLSNSNSSRYTSQL